VVTDDGEDRYRLNQGNDALGRVVWSSAFTFDFLTGGDDGFGSQNLITDLDGDGWNDVLISDVDVDIDEGCTNRLHIYHNRGGAVGGNPLLREEAQAPSSGWRGAVGLMPSDLNGTFHTAVFDVDGDLDQDLVIGRCNGTSVWMNTKNPCPLANYGTVNPNSTGQPARMSFYGCGDLSNRKLIFNVTNLPPNTTGRVMYASLPLSPCANWGNGKLCLHRRALIQPPLPTVTADASGHARFEMDFDELPLSTAQPGQHRYFQFRYDDPAAGGAGFNLSEAVDVSICQ
jgi:hypothetical protein